jgi:hypothetical protein
MTRLENMTEFLKEFNWSPEKEPVATVLWHLAAAERELADCRNAEFRKSIKIADLLLEIEKLGEQRDRLVEALQACMRWSDCTDIPNEVQRMCHQALAAAKGEKP